MHNKTYYKLFTGIVMPNAPLEMMYQYIPQLKSFRDVYVDSGDREVDIAKTVRQLQGILDTYGIVLRWAIYTGDHVDRIHRRITTQLMPMFSEVLVTR